MAQTARAVNASRARVERIDGPQIATLVAGIRISHPDRVFPEIGINKLDLARYYEQVGPHMLPHVRGRPLTLLLWTAKPSSGRRGVFMRHSRAWGPDVLRRISIEEKTKVGEYLVVDDIAGLVALAQMDVLEIHTWNSVAGDLERPDRIVFDLDPGTDVPWPAVVEAAIDVRAALTKLGLACWPKTTGGKGLHLVVPLAASTADWASSFSFARAFAQTLARLRPDRFVAKTGEAQRVGRVFVDYLRNNRGSTSVAAFSIRARPGAPVSMPVAWHELEQCRAADFTIRTTRERLGRLPRDPWEDYWTCNQTLPSLPRS